MSDPFPATVDRHAVPDFLWRAIAAAESLPRAKLHKRMANPAGLPLELWFDDAAEADLYTSRLATVTPQIAQEAAARIYVLSAASLGSDALPSLHEEPREPAALYAILEAAGLRAAYPLRPQEWLALDPAARIGIQLARSPTALPGWFAGSPLRQHLHWLLRARDQRVAHAATVGRNGRGILILGNGRAGKSGTCLAGIAAGLQTVGDDYIALGGVAPAIARPLFRIMKQDRVGLARIQGLAERLATLPENWNAKVEFDPSSVFPGCFADALRIGAVVLPAIAHAKVPRVVAVGHGEAMRALMRTNLHQFPGEPEDGLDYYAALVRSLPAYRLELSETAADNGAALADVVAGLQ